MAFVMGWSSLVFASTMPMHAKMLQQQMADAQQVTAVVFSEHEQHQSVDKTQSNCHSATAAMQHHAHMDAQKNHCESGLHGSAGKQCADCAQLHCQTLSIWLDTAVTDPLQYFHPDTLTNLHSRYTAQHLIGYWQEILRPPKA